MALRPFCELRAVSAEESGADGDLEKGSSDGKRSPCAPKEWHPKDCRVCPVALPQEDAMDSVYDDGRQHAQYCLVQSARRAPVVIRDQIQWTPYWTPFRKPLCALQILLQSGCTPTVQRPVTTGDPRCGELLESRIVDGTLWAIIHYNHSPAPVSGAGLVDDITGGAFYIKMLLL